MAKPIYVLVAEDATEMAALADEQKMDILDGSISAFADVETFTTPGMASVGQINSAKSGLIALARAKSVPPA